MNFRHQSLRIFTCAALVITTATGCGQKKKSDEKSTVHRGPIAAAFEAAAIKHNVPARMLLAVAFKESGLSAKPESAIYLTSDSQLGISLSETAFGVPRAKLGLPTDDSPIDMATQVDAYAAWVKRTLEERHIKLDANPSSAEQKYDWIWQIAQMHRDGMEARRNVQIVFALEMMEKLNFGDIWQDPESGEIVELTKEINTLTMDSFPIQIRKNLELFTDESDVYGAQYFELTHQQPEENYNKPTHIRVIHCPLSLSACLELQNPTNDQNALRLSAHYIIPPDKSVVSEPLQVAQHRTALLLTNNQGEPERVSDAIIVMLVGDSGRYEGGKRTSANPKWFTKYQMEKMGTIIRNVCPIIARTLNPELDPERCMTPGLPDGVNFIHQGSSEAYQWGDIADYDENIFGTYINTPKALNGEVFFEFGGGQRVFDANNTINFALKFIRGTAKVVLERLERCSDGKLVWTTTASHEVRNTNNKSFAFNLYHKGPNGNGQQFFRALVYDEKGGLMGWSIDDLYLSNYDDSEGPGADVKTCQRNGT